MSISCQISSWNRNRKWKLFLRELSIDKDIRILDVGFSENEYSNTDNFIEKHYPFPEMLTALGVDTPDEIKRRYPKVNFVHYDGKKFPFKDKEFDICWSNAVIEHVGEKDDQLFFLKEIDRVAKSAFITTPNRNFPIEVHTRTPFLHYLPKKLFDRYLDFIGKKWATNGYMYLLTITDLKKLLAKAHITDYKIYKNRLVGFSLDFVVIFHSS